MCGCFMLIGMLVITISLFAAGQIPLGIISIVVWLAILGGGSKQNTEEEKKAEQERLAKEAAEQKAKEKAEQEQKAREKAEQERKAREKAEQERRAREKAEQERKAREKAEQERKAKEKAAENKQKQRFCANCGKPLPEDETAFFCMYCGTKTEAANAQAKTGNEKIVLQAGKCPVCGNATGDTDSVCANCGFPVISIAGNISKKEKEKILEAVREYREKMAD